MFLEALIFTSLVVFILLALAVGVLWWLFAATYGQHADAGDGALSVAHVRRVLDEEMRAQVAATAPLAPVRLLPRPHAPHSVWTPPELMAA